MKKRILFIVLATALLTSVFCQVNSKEGYFKLKWGSSIEDAKKAGYKFIDLSEDEKQSYKDEFVEPVDTYKIVPDDKNVREIVFSYYMGKFFLVTEYLKSPLTSQKKLEDRYGKFEKQNILKYETMYYDVIFGPDGKVQNMSISIALLKDGSALTQVMDWDVYKNISVFGRQLSGNDTSVVNELKELASKLLQDGKNGNKPSYAFLNFSSDNKNSSTETYVTDALTEAVFNTGKVKIIERANLEKILTEQKFQSSGLVNEETAKSIGNIAGVDYVCYGTIKDTGNELTISARVVDVESGEVCAMARDNIQKDEYLKKQVGNNGSNSTNNSIAPDPVKTVNSLWQVRKSRNEFDGYTTYTFMLKSPSDKWVFFGYDKNDIQSKSLVRAGIYGNDSWSEGRFDIKTEDGNVINKYFNYAIWSKDTGWKDGKERFEFTYNKGESARFFLNLFEKNNYLTIRHNGVVQRFQTSGLWNVIEAQGITKKEIENAIANEEF